MPRLSRREFLKLSGGAAAIASLTRAPWARAAAPSLASPGPTTLDQVITKGVKLADGTLGSYYRLTFGSGEPHLPRTDLHPASTAPIRRAMSFVHFTDSHLVDAQSPARVEFLDRYAEQQCGTLPFNAAFRPHEALALHVQEEMIRAVRRVHVGPATGKRFAFVMATGDNTDNEQFNELRWFIDLMDGGKTVTANSGDLTRYEGVQDAAWGDEEYWHPDPVADKYKAQWGYPDYPGLLSKAIRPFQAKGVGLPWWQTFGNHDGLMQGNAPRNDALAAVATGPLKFDGPPPGLNVCDPFNGLGTTYLPTHPVTADADRRNIRRNEYIEQFFHTTGTPSGHGFTELNRTSPDEIAYYVRDDLPLFRFISLDTVNPGGYSEGSIGQKQFDWLTARLIEVHARYYGTDGSEITTGNRDRLVVLFSHHGIRSLSNPLQDPNPDDPASNDLPRLMGADVEALLHRFPNVIAWVTGHTHDNVITPRPDASGRTAGFWDIGTAAHIDWTSQSRIVEIAHRTDGTLSIFCTMVDHAAHPDPGGLVGIARLASINRELCANDPQYGFASKGPGTPEDRNVELLLPAPAWIRKS